MKRENDKQESEKPGPEEPITEKEGRAAPREIKSRFEDLHYKFVRGLEDAWLEAQRKYADAYYKYLSERGSITRDSQEAYKEVTRDYRDTVREKVQPDETRKRSEDAYREYLAAMQEAQGSEEAREKAAVAYRNYLAAIQDVQRPEELWQTSKDAYRDYEKAVQNVYSPKVALSSFDAYNNYVRSIEEIDKQLADSYEDIYRAYQKAIREAWTSVGTDVDARSLAAIGQSMVSAAYYSARSLWCSDRKLV